MEGKDAETGIEYDAASAASIGFFESVEYQNKNKTDEEFLTDLYHAFFNREPDAGGYSYWLDMMANKGYSRRRVIIEGFGTSLEFRNVLQNYGFEIK